LIGAFFLFNLSGANLLSVICTSFSQSEEKSKEENKLSGIFYDQTANPLPQRGDCFMLLIYQKATIQQLITKCRGTALMG
jgi:hypothetical protein